MSFRSFEVTPLDCNISLKFRPLFNEMNGLNFKRSFSGNDPHIIYIPKNERKDLIHIHLCGTASKANEDSIEFLKSSVFENLVTVGLNYEWGEPDLIRVERCESITNNSNEALDIMHKFHEDIVIGAKECTCGLINIDNSSTILQRLKDLILYLNLNDTDTSSIWKSLIKTNTTSNYNSNNDTSNINDIDWKRIILSGHSQGAGHAAWLAQRVPLHTLVLLSGPQEGGEHLDLLSSHWLDRPCLANHVRCLKHKQEEGRNNQMIESSIQRIFNSTSFAVVDININREMCMKIETVLSLPKNSNDCVLLRSDVSPAVILHPGHRPNHMSTCLDAWTPRHIEHGEKEEKGEEEIEKEGGSALYARWVWGYLLLGDKCSASESESVTTLTSIHSSL